MKKAICLLLAVLMTMSAFVSLAGCRRNEEESKNESQTESLSESGNESQAPAVFAELTDQAGRKVTLEKEPERIVSGYYISTSALIALGLRSRVVGMEAKANTRPIYRLAAPEFLELPNVGTAKQFDLEGCLSLQPDIVFLPLKLESAVESLEGFGIPVVLVNPESEELMLEMVELIAKACGKEDEAKKLKNFIADAEALLKDLPAERPSVYLAGNSALLTAAGTGMYQSSLIELAGGVNAAAEISDSYWAEISYEQLLGWDPDYIILPSDAGYSVEDVKADAVLAELSAVRGNRVFQMPGDVEAWDSPVPGGVLGALWLAGVLHPDTVSTDLFNQYAKDFYEQFYGFTYGGLQD